MAKDRRSSTRQRIVSAASREFARGGFDAVSVQRICERAKVAHGTMFVHFASKSELYREVVKQTGDDFVRALGPHLDREQLSLEQLLDALAAHVGSHPDFAGLLSPRREESGRIDQASRALHEVHVDFWREAIGRLERQGHIAPGTRGDDVARLIAATVTGLLATVDRRHAGDALAPMEGLPELLRVAATSTVNGGRPAPARSSGAGADRGAAVGTP